jgi:hypothetical protein
LHWRSYKTERTGVVGEVVCMCMRVSEQQYLD